MSAAGTTPRPTHFPPAELTVRVEAIDQEAEAVLALTLVDVQGGPLPSWEPGAHIDVILPNCLERQYSLCGDVDDPNQWRVAVLREPDSRGGSEWIHDQLKVGDTLGARGPRNHFALVDFHTYLFIGGGIGITPLLPMIRQVEESGKPWKLLYGGRTETSMGFVREVEKYGDKVLLRPEDRYGLLDIADFLGGPSSHTAVYCCGPGLLLDAVEQYCSSWPHGVLHIERFRPAAGALDGPNTAFDVVLEQTGITVHVAGNQTVVEALEAHGVVVPTSCREGTCGTCETEVLDGEPDHRDSFLTGEERAEGYAMMVCCSRSFSSELVLDL